MEKRRIIKEMEYVCTPSYKNMVLRESSPIDSFHSETCVGSHDGQESVSFVNPIQMLFNQIRLDNIGEQSLRQWLEGQPEDSALSEVMKQCSVEDVMSTIKSRYLQQPCEIRAWAEYTQYRFDDFKNRVQDAQKKEQAAQQAAQQAAASTESKTE